MIKWTKDRLRPWQLVACGRFTITKGATERERILWDRKQEPGIVYGTLKEAKAAAFVRLSPLEQLAKAAE